MKKTILKTLLITPLLFTGCATQIGGYKLIKEDPQDQKITPQQWLQNPFIDGDQVAAVGCAIRNAKGKSAQRKAAIAIAIDEIAKSKKATVESVSLRKKSVSSSGRYSSSTKSASLQSVNKVSVSTTIKDTYIKPNGEICVWVVQK